jgi:hypothetical protein
MKWLQASISFLVLSLSLYSQVPSVLAQSYLNTKTRQISQKLPPSIDNQSKLPVLGFAARFKPPVDEQPNLPTLSWSSNSWFFMPQKQTGNNSLTSGQ